MPADSSARYYQWFMADTHEGNRIIMYEWWPADGEIVSSMTVGTLYFKHRDTADDVWSPGRVVGEENLIMWVVAQSFVRSEGFTVEEAVH